MPYYSYQYRIYPTKTQIATLETYSDTLRRWWNTINGLMRNKDSPEWEPLLRATEREKKDFWTIKYYIKHLRAINPYFADMPYDSLTDIVSRFETTWKEFWKKPERGKPKFKPFDAAVFVSLRCRKPDPSKLISGQKGKHAWLKFPKIGDVKTVYHRAIPENHSIEWLIINRNKTGKWFVTCQIRSDEPRRLYPEQSCDSVGIDLGIHHLLALSDGTIIDNPKWFVTNQQRLRVLSRKASWRGKWSKADSKGHKRLLKKTRRHEDTRLELAHHHGHIKNRRMNYYHELTTWLTNTYRVIVLEDINWKWLRDNKRMAKAIGDAAFGIFYGLLEAKAVERGCEVIYVPPHYTSQLCSGCGEMVKKDLSVRVHHCPHCGLKIDRDVNAAINILARGDLLNVV